MLTLFHFYPNGSPRALNKLFQAKPTSSFSSPLHPIFLVAFNKFLCEQYSQMCWRYSLRRDRVCPGSILARPSGGSKPGSFLFVLSKTALRQELTPRLSGPGGMSANNNSYRSLRQYVPHFTCSISLNPHSNFNPHFTDEEVKSLEAS